MLARAGPTAKPLVVPTFGGLRGVISAEHGYMVSGRDYDRANLSCSTERQLIDSAARLREWAAD